MASHSTTSDYHHPATYIYRTPCYVQPPTIPAPSPRPPTLGRNTTDGCTTILRQTTAQIQWISLTHCLSPCVCLSLSLSILLFKDLKALQSPAAAGRWSLRQCHRKICPHGGGLILRDATSCDHSVGTATGPACRLDSILGQRTGTSTRGQQGGHTGSSLEWFIGWIC